VEGGKATIHTLSGGFGPNEKLRGKRFKGEEEEYWKNTFTENLPLGSALSGLQPKFLIRENQYGKNAMGRRD